MNLKLARQTRTCVHSREAAQQNRAQGNVRAYRFTAAAQLLLQAMLWVTFYGYQTHAVWLAALMLLVPLGLLVAVWRIAAPAVSTRAGAWWCLALVPCLMLDTALLLRALCGYLGQAIPVFPFAADLAVPAVACVLSVLFARENGVAYGVFALRAVLVVLFLCSTVFQTTNASPTRLWPLLGPGLKPIAAAALSGAGCVWGVALLALPREAARLRPHARDALWALVPWALAVVWALWYAMVRPWRMGDELVIGEKLMGLARHARSTFLYELTGLWWMLLLPLMLAASVSSGEKLVRRALPKAPRWVCCAGMLLPAAVGGAVWPEAWLMHLGYALPWRAALSLIAGIGLAVTAKKGGKG